jgi:murein DD-endopeptidase MepM/ murein hydrolase activator NlpD
MRRLAPLALLLCAVLTGVARADVYEVVPSPLPGLTALTLPGSDVPNSVGSVAYPDSIMSPPAAPVQLSQPDLLALWQRAGAAYGVEWQVLAAINKVESNFGRNMGPSSAGAIGWMQFMPDTWYRWGVDADGDGVADPWNPTDAVFSAARYLAAAGGSTDVSRAVYAYNHADWYVQEVIGLAQLYGADGTVAFSLDRLQVSLDAARTAVVAANARVLAVQTTLRAETRTVARWQARAASARLLSDRLALEQRAGNAGALRAQVAAVFAARQQALTDARAQLALAQQQSAAASFAPAASQLLGAPSYSSGYVFPVGGGPGVVFASHTHHDYPAVDIAAPLGSPLYALADAVVLRAWSAPDPRCGIGFTLRASDGQIWTYCHLSVLGAAVVPGATLTAGQAVGLVGATGDATGPHLHLQLQPAREWPQQEAWFASFSGTAFTWSDAGPNAASAAVRTLAAVAPPVAQAPVFQVEATPDPSNEVVFFSRSGS